MRTLGFLLEKEFKELFRNPIFMGVFIFFTAITLFFFPYAISFDMKRTPVTIVNHDMGTYGHRLIQKIEGTPTFDIVSLHTDYQSAMDDIEEGTAIMVIEIPDDFSEKIDHHESAKVYSMVNAVDGTQASIAASYVTNLVQQYSEELIKEATGRDLAVLIPLEIRPMYRYNETLNYRFFMLPALLVVMITMYAGIFPSVLIVDEKERGTLQQIHVTPVRRSTFILSKIIPYWLMVQIVLALSVPIIYWAHGMPLAGNYLVLALCTFVFGVVMSFFGVTVSNVSETHQQSMFLIIFVILIFFLISGLFTPVDAMPVWARAIAYANPVTYFITIARMLYMKGSGFMDILPDLLILCGFSVVMFFVAVFTHHKRTD